eukprot:GILI01009798.1.p1 GENE.GILI01009798.1~~GILI01009798.1.p1  ORF type:complete len:106 (-),score=10.23 GILI01009798.1:145-423(-)
MGALDDNGVISIHGYLITPLSALSIACVVSLSVYLAVIRYEGPEGLKSAKHPAIYDAPSIVSCLGCFLPLAIYIVYSALLAIGPKGTKSAIS